eukprot:gene13175-3975_t
MAEITKIEQLNGKNYQSWKYNMKLVLMERGLWGFIQDEQEVPPQSADASARNAYRLRSDKAYSLIALSVQKTLQVHIASTVNPKEAWDILQKHYELVSVTQIVRLNRIFYAASMKEGDYLMEHITYMTSFAEQLRESKEDISSKKLAIVVLSSLPESYDNFLTSLNARDADEMEWDISSAYKYSSFIINRHGMYSKIVRTKLEQYKNSVKENDKKRRLCELDVQLDEEREFNMIFFDSTDEEIEQVEKLTATASGNSPHENSCQTEPFSKVLGVNWDSESNDLFYDLGSVLELAQSFKPTKRSLLKIAAKIFDPLGEEEVDEELGSVSLSDLESSDKEEDVAERN